MTDLTRDSLLAELDQPFRYYDSVDSTNDIALQWLHAGADAGSVVIADEQRRGRGRKGRIWHTPPGVALAISVILHPPPAYANRVSMLGALCVAELCEQIGCEGVGIKWPNDVQIHGKKVCGVLPEAAWDDNQLCGVVLGMGINVRVEFTGELAVTATSIEAALGKPVSRTMLLSLLIQRIENWRERIGSDALFAAWKSGLTTLGQRVQVDTVAGIAQDVDTSGALFIETVTGSVQRVIAGDLSLIMPREDNE